LGENAKAKAHADERGFWGFTLIFEIAWFRPPSAGALPAITPELEDEASIWFWVSAVPIQQRCRPRAAGST